MRVTDSRKPVELRHLLNVAKFHHGLKFGRMYPHSPLLSQHSLHSITYFFEFAYFIFSLKQARQMGGGAAIPTPRPALPPQDLRQGKKYGILALEIGKCW